MSGTCFVVSPIGKEGSDIRKNADYLFKFILKPICDMCELECIRCDHIQQSDVITSTIIDHLKNSELVIADMTGHNPNVFYEIGFRYAINKPIIQMITKKESIPFDLGATRTIDYDLQDLADVDKVRETLKNFINNALKFDTKIEEDNYKDDSELIIERLDKIQDQIALINNGANGSILKEAFINKINDQYTLIDTNKELIATKEALITAKDDLIATSEEFIATNDELIAKKGKQ